MLFELGNGNERLLAIDLGALDDSWLSSLVPLHVPLKRWGVLKTFATKLAIVRPNGVHLSPMREQITLYFACIQTAWNITLVHFVLLRVHLQVLGDGESFIASKVVAFEDAWGVCFMFLLMLLEINSALEHFTTDAACKAIEFVYLVLVPLQTM
jgi:hypothetical protein